MLNTIQRWYLKWQYSSRKIHNFRTNCKMYLVINTFRYLWRKASLLSAMHKNNHLTWHWLCGIVILVNCRWKAIKQKVTVMYCGGSSILVEPSITSLLSLEVSLWQTRNYRQTIYYLQGKKANKLNYTYGTSNSLKCLPQIWWHRQ